MPAPPLGFRTLSARHGAFVASVCAILYGYVSGRPEVAGVGLAAVGVCLVQVGFAMRGEGPAGKAKAGVAGSGGALAWMLAALFAMSTLYLALSGCARLGPVPGTGPAQNWKRLSMRLNALENAMDGDQPPPTVVQSTPSAAAVAAVAASAPPRGILKAGGCRSEANTDFVGHDLYSKAIRVEARSFDACCRKCRETEACNAFSLAFGDCWLKSKVTSRKVAKGIVSGTLSTAARATTPY